MSLETLALRVLVYGFAFGFLIGGLYAYNKKLFHGFVFTYFAAVIVASMFAKPEEISNVIAPSLISLVGQMGGAILGFETGKHAYRNTLTEKRQTSGTECVES